MKVETVTETKTFYVAEDGTRFATDIECSIHEEMMHRNFKYMIGDMNYIYTSAEKVYPMGDYANGVLIIEIQNKAQADRFLIWLNSVSEYFRDMNADNIVGEVLVCDCYDEGEGADAIENVYECITPHDAIINFANTLHSYESRLRKNGAKE